MFQGIPNKIITSVDYVDYPIRRNLTKAASSPKVTKKVKIKDTKLPCWKIGKLAPSLEK